MADKQVQIRAAQLTDLDALVALENTSFSTDKLSRRSFKHWLTTHHRALLIAEQDLRLIGYILIIYH
ncbi:MAG: ribosomal-protein-alanine acetyltransferase, partial [Methylococcales bacterium]